MTEVTGLHHAALSVADLDRSLAWYERVFDVEPIMTDGGDGWRRVVMRVPGAGAVLGLVQHQGTGDRSFDPANVGLDALAFTVESRADLEGWAQDLTAKGVEHSGINEIPPGATVNLKDPDGIALVLFWDRVAPPR